MALIHLRGLVPIARVADVARSIDFYRQLGFELLNTFESDGRLAWASLANGGAHLMLSRSAQPMSSGERDVFLYLYAHNVAEYRNELLACGVNAGPMTFPFYMKDGEFRIDDPDGYVLLVGQAEETSN